MKQISQTTEVLFSAPSLKDAIILVEVMNSLVMAINNNEDLSLVIGRPDHVRSSLTMTTEMAKKVYKTLNDMGFESAMDLNEKICQV